MEFKETKYSSTDELEKKVDKILFYLYKDDDTGKTGLVQDVKQLKIELQELKQKFRDRDKFIKGMSFAFAAVGTLVGFIIKYLITKFL